MNEEVARILRNVAKKIERGQMYGAVLDLNGNTVGKYWLRGAQFQVTIGTENDAFQEG